MDSRDIVALDSDLKDTQTDLAALKANLIALDATYRLECTPQIDSARLTWIYIMCQRTERSGNRSAPYRPPDVSGHNEQPGGGNRGPSFVVSLPSL